MIVLLAMVWKVMNNHDELKILKERQNRQMITSTSEISTRETPAVQPEIQIKQDPSNLVTNPEPANDEKTNKIVANPDETLEEGFEWTDVYYDPNRLEEPGYRDKVMEHLRAKHYYESPQRQMPPFQQSRDLLNKWNVESNLENTVLLHDAAIEWHRNLYYAERDSGPAAGPEAKERVEFMTEFKKKSIKGRFKDIFGIEDEAFMKEFVKIKPDRPILGPKLKIDPGQRLMRIIE